MKKALQKLAIILILLTAVLPHGLLAQSSSDWQHRIDQLNAEINNNQATLDEVSHNASTLQSKVNAINAEIAQLQSQIDLANLQIQHTQAQIREAIARLERAKRIMYENARTLYKIGDPSTVEILASSDNFSEFVNRQEYLETVKENVNRAAREIVAMKDELEAKEKDLANFVQQLEVQQAIIQSKYNEQARLLAETRGEEARYQEMVSSLKAQRNQAEQQLLASRPRGGDGSGTAVRAGQTVSGGGTVGYVGDSGFAEGAHLHFALIENGAYQDPMPYLNGGVTWPVPGYTEISQPYGCVPNSWYNQGGCPPGYSFHRGVDIAAPYGSQAVATEFGTVTFAGCWAGSGFGNVVIVDHGSHQTYYPHLGSGCR